MQHPDAPILFCIPIFNDWQTAMMLLNDLEIALTESGLTARVMFVDDGSSDVPAFCDCRPLTSVLEVEVLSLRRNVGHQRAIALGLTFAHVKREFGAVIVMDGDGEDQPRDAMKLYQHWTRTGRQNVVFAARARRTESFTFRAFYQAYKVIHWVLTGRKVEVGNFSLLPPPALARLVAVSEIWNHYAAAVFKARLPTDQIPIPRGRRLAGKSTMNFTSLVVHGLSAISVFGDQIGVRLLVGNTVVGLFVMLVLGSVAGLRMFTDQVIPGWATMAGGLMLILLFVGFLLTLIFVFIILQSRSGTSFLPLRDYSYYIARSIVLPIKPVVRSTGTETLQEVAVHGGAR